MSNQQSMFAEPEHRPPQQLDESNTDPREQEWRGAQETYPVYGEEAYQSGVGGAKIQPQRPKKKSRPTIIPLAILCVFLLGGFLLFRAAGTHSIQYNGSQASTSIYHAPVVGRAKVVIHDSAGDIHVQSGAQGDISVASTQDGASKQVDYRQEGDTLVISVNNGGDLFSNSPIDLTITVPQSSDVQVDANSGSVELGEISGSIQVKTESGSIDAHNLSGQVALNTSSGSITTEGLSGQATVASSSGSIDVSQASLNGDSAFSTDSGSISYGGALASGQTYQFSSSSGDVNLNLPENSSIDAKTQTSSGDVQNDFSNPVGNASAAHVSVTTSSGSIEIQKGA